MDETPKKSVTKDLETWKCDPLEMFNVVKATAIKILHQRGEPQTKFIVNENNKPILQKLCYYFSRDNGFSKLHKGGSLYKGVLICGGVGVGKTIIMKALAWNPLLPFRVVSVRSIADNYEIYGSHTVNAYAFPERNLSGGGNADYVGYCFDDLGTEELEKAHYGNRANVIEKLILNRYDNCAHTLTHFTTNLTAGQIKEAYGVRAVDRLREMVNIIEFPVGAKSFRK